MAKDIYFKIPTNKPAPKTKKAKAATKTKQPEVHLTSCKCRECGSPGYKLEKVVPQPQVHLTSATCKTCGSPGYKLELVKPSVKTVYVYNPGYCGRPGVRPENDNAIAAYRDSAGRYVCNCTRCTERLQKLLAAAAANIIHSGLEGRLYFNPNTGTAYWLASPKDFAYNARNKRSTVESINKTLGIPGVSSVLITYFPPVQVSYLGRFGVISSSLV
jgi:hypothetical protein